MGVTVREKTKGSGVWWVFWHRKNKRGSKKVGTRKAAEDLAKTIRAQMVIIDAGLTGYAYKEAHEDTGLTFTEYLLTWQRAYGEKILAASTYRGYQSKLRKHILPRFGNTPIKEIRPAQVKEFVIEKRESGLALKTVKQIKNLMSGIFSQALQDEIIQINPATGLDKFLTSKDSGEDKEVNPYTAAELSRYLNTVKEHSPEHYPLFLILSKTGMRFGEVLGLQWSDIDFDSNIITVSHNLNDDTLELIKLKNGKSRKIPLSPELKTVLKKLHTARKEQTLRKAWGQVPESVFINRKGKPMNQRNLRNRVHYNAIEKAGMKRITVHDIRHTFATLLLLAGWDVRIVSRILGHRSVSITEDIYFHWIPENHAGKAGEIDDIILYGPEKDEAEEQRRKVRK